MNKSKALLGFAIMLGMMALSVTSASAWFEQGKATSGTGNVNASSLGVSGSVAAECAEAPFIDEVVEVSKQVHTKVSTHLLIKAIGWTKCTVGGAAATVTGFEFQLVQSSKGQTKGIRNNIVKGGSITSTGCTIKIEAGAENQGLKELSGSNGPGAEEIKGIAAVTGITYKASGLTCAIIGLKEGKNSEFKAENLKASDVTEI